MKISRVITVLVVLALVGGALYLVLGQGAFSPGKDASGDSKTGGDLVVAYRIEPRTFNRYVAPQQAEELVSRLTQATLVRLDRTTRRLEPRLAREWSGSPDGLAWTLKLREGVTFSDGAPFTSADVLFSFQVLYDPGVRSEIASSLLIEGKPLRVRALDASTVVVILPAPYGPGIALLDAVPILPRHKLKAAFDAGTFREAWSVTTPISEIVGLGPFVVREYAPGERLVFGRNPHFWRRDTGGRTLPYLDRLELQFVPDQNAEVLRLQSGDVDLISNQVRFEDLASLRDLQTKGQITLHEAGVSISPDMMWFNLDPTAKSARQRPWLQREDLRRAISSAVNREAIVNTVFLGEALQISGPITPGHGEWFLPELPQPAFDSAEASRLLASIGLSDRNGDGLLDDERGQTAKFSVLTQKGHSVRERSASMVQEQLRKVGLQIDVVPLETRSMIDLWGKGEYDAIYFAIEFDSFDPARHLDFWMSSGAFHFWHPRQVSPSTTWEARIDALMTTQSTTLDPVERKRIFADAQRILAEHAPVLYFAAPKVILATNSRVRGVMPSVLSPSVLWNAEMISVSRPPASTRR